MEQEKGWKRYVATGIGTVVLGALGSGLWEVTGASLGRLSSWLLTLVTLGISSARDEMYAHAAVGFREEPSVMLLITMWAFGMGVMTAICIAPPFLRLIPRLRANRGLQEPPRVPWIRFRKAKKILAVLIPLLLLEISAVSVQVLMVLEQNKVIVHYRQYLEIDRPFISEPRYQMFVSRFARMKTKADYDSIVSDLRSIGVENKIEMPKFDTW